MMRGATGVSPAAAAAPQGQIAAAAANANMQAQALENQTLGSSVASPSQKIAAINRYSSQQRTNSSFALGGSVAVAAVQVGFAVLQAERRQEEDRVVKARFELVRLNSLQESAQHFASVSGNWYVRPFMRAEGWGLCVVDLRSGRQANLWLTPGAKVLPSLGLVEPQFATDEPRHMLLAVGTGLDPVCWQTFPWNSPNNILPYGGTVLNSQKDMGTFPAGRYAVPFPAVLAFDTDSLPSGLSEWDKNAIEALREQRAALAESERQSALALARRQAAPAAAQQPGPDDKSKPWDIAHFKAVGKGQTKAQVTANLGEPATRMSLKEPSTGAVEMWLWSYSMPSPGSAAVSFDGGGRVCDSAYSAGGVNYHNGAAAP